MDLELGGKSVLITGASQGIGDGLAEVFAVRLRKDHDIEVAVQEQDIAATGAAEAISKAAGRIDVLVNNAGSIPGGDLWQVDQTAWRRGWEVKVFGYINLCRAFYASMKAAGGGVIVNNIGNGGENFDFRYIAGSTGNAALMAFTRALGGCSLDDGIRVVGVNPGPSPPTGSSTS